MQVVSAAVRASSPATVPGATGASTGWPTALKSEPRTSCTVPGVSESTATTAEPGMVAATVAARASSPVAYRTSVRSRSEESALPLLGRSEEHTSELQSRQYLVCRLLLEK